MILDIDFSRKSTIAGATVGMKCYFLWETAGETNQRAGPAGANRWEEFAIIVDGLSEPELHALAQSILLTPAPS